jgi:hypothetical protein
MWEIRGLCASPGQLGSGKFPLLERVLLRKQMKEREIEAVVTVVAGNVDFKANSSALNVLASCPDLQNRSSKTAPFGRRDNRPE